MKEIIEDTEYDDQYEPVEMVKNDGFRNGVPTTFYTITVEADFDDEFVEILEEFDLDVSGYILETIILAYLEYGKAELIDNIVSFDTEMSTFVAYADTEENQHEIAALIQKLCTSKKAFKKIIKENLEEIRTKYS
ncbi:Imm51 family immunity protein [Rhodocytophaga aerolata]|uniref:Imm51 family immunity protein n=1 Tax=Rhodocytophaga aerolata TaxID=455078 RepID=A0ABT8RGS6_9BACT|nr:Imm51 family immunity protein [Rhodocytophaga aerolata]MDO1451290.1 Imm51 family immunity protein [Rhodocytophaga aerolata]